MTKFPTPEIARYHPLIVQDPKLIRTTKTQALNDAEKNKFQIKGRYQNSGSGGGIPIPFNAARGSVRVTANGQLLVEGVDYVENLQIIDKDNNPKSEITLKDYQLVKVISVNWQ